MKRLPKTFDFLYDSLYQFWHYELAECYLGPCSKCLIQPECGMIEHILDSPEEKKQQVEE